MTSKEFVIWMKGFAVGSSKFNLTPEGWDELKSQLQKVNDDVIPMGGLLTDYNRFGTSTTTSLPSGSSISYTTSNERIF
jgi:hypothetical protein